MKDTLHTALQELALAVKRIVNDRISRYGINPKTGENTLENSNLQKSLQVNPTNDGIELQIANYWMYVARGWQRTHNYPGTMSLFIRNIDNWVNRKNIRFGNMTQAQIVFVIIRNIMENGLKARPFMIYDDGGDLTKMIPELDKYLDKWFAQLETDIFKELDDYFK